MIDHISYGVIDFDRSIAYYDATLALLGYARLMTFDSTDDGNRVAGYGAHNAPKFWIGWNANPKEIIGKAEGFHIAFSAPTQQAVHDWYEICLTLGGICNGKPGPRPEYHPGYYAAFIIDPNGWRTESVIHTFHTI